MKKSKLFSIFISFVFIWSCADRSSDNITNSNPQNGFTQLTGPLSGTVSLAQSPYQVIDTIFVDSTQRLIIQKGVKLHFTDSAMFVIYGSLEAVGDSDYFVHLTAYRNHWKGIRVINSDQNSLFRYCVIEKVFTDWQDSSQFGALEINSSTATIQNCIFRQNNCYYGGGLSLLGDISTITNNILRENKTVVFGGGILAVESSARIINNTFFSNLSENVGGGLVVVDPVTMDVQNNIFFENVGNTGDPGIWLISADSSGFNQQYNFLPMGSENPQFISNDNLHLRDYSPCVNAGNHDPAYNDADGSRNDQGAYGGPLGNW